MVRVTAGRMNRTPLLVLAAFSVVTAFGCSPRGFEMAAATVGTVAFVAAAAESAKADEATEAADYAEQEARARQALWSRPDEYLVPQASAKDTVTAPKAPAFDPVRARNNLGNVNLSSCSVHGRGRVSGHATVTYARTGAVSKVVIDSPAGLPTELVACVGNTLGATTVPAFEGSAIGVGTSWQVP